MPLSATAQALLAGCVRAIVMGGPTVLIDLTPLDDKQPPGEWMPDGIEPYLASEMARQSGGRQTMRLADPALFSSRLPRAVYMVVCSIDTHRSTVIELADGMTLLSISPYVNGLTYPAHPNSPEGIRWYRDDIAVRQQRAREHAAAEQQIADLRTALNIVLRQWAETAASPNVRDEVRRLTSHSGGTSLENIALACVKLGVPLRELLHTAI